MSRVFGLQCQCALTNSILAFGRVHTIFGSENSIGNWGLFRRSLIIPLVGWRLHSSNNVIVHFCQVKKNVFLYLHLSLVFTLSSHTTKCQGTFPSNGLRNIHKSRQQQSPNLVFVRPLTDAMIIPSPLHQLSFSLLLVRVNYKP